MNINYKLLLIIIIIEKEVNEETNLPLDYINKAS